MRGFWARRSAAVAVATVVALIWSLLGVVAPAQADTMPPNPTDPKTPVTVSADPLPTVQIDGVAWTQRVVGNTVYVGGRFTTARPAGAAPGTQTTARANLLAYDIRTGNLITSWAPTTNGDVLSIMPSPDGSRVYVGGSFTQVNGQIRNRIAALNPTTGALIGSFQPKPDATVRAIAATADTVYMGGLLSAVGGVTRPRSAAVRASDGALLPWSPNAQGGSVHALVLSPDNSQVVLGGSFTTMNGSNNPGYGLARVDATTAAPLPLPANSLIRNGGASAAITGLSVDSDSVYVSGFVYGPGGNLEGIARIGWDTGAVRWVQDCHGDHYGSFPKGDVVYTISHAHYCGNLPDGPPQTPSWTYYWGTAFTKAVTGTLGRDPLGYYNYQGQPSPNMLKWLPELINGTFTGQGQAGWNVTGNSDYVVIGGEFPRANNVGQQGLVRYAVPGLAPNDQGPELDQSHFNPKLDSWARGTVKISWPANWDRDNEQLTYSVIRNGNIASPIHTTTQLSSQWRRPPMGYLDRNLVPGQEYRYRVFAKDPFGNEVRSDTVTIVASDSGEISPYAESVMADGPWSYWRLGESSGTTVTDWGGFDNATAGTGVTRGAAGAIVGDANTASSFNGASNASLVASGVLQDGPDVFTTEAWFKSTSSTGGKIIGFGNRATGTSSTFDRHVYLTNAGQIRFGVYPGSAQTVVSPLGGYNNGQWHHVVASLGSDGMNLYVDGARVANRTDVTTAHGYMGYWRIGGDGVSGWPSAPTSGYLNGTIDDVAVYQRVLSAAEVQDHFERSQGGPGNQPPTADFDFTAADLDVSFDGTASADPDGTVEDYSWDFDDGQSSTEESPDHTYAAAGSYDVTLTVTDNDGETDAITKTVNVTAPGGPLAADAFGRSVTNGWGSADTGGAWTRYGGNANQFSVSGGTGRIQIPTAGGGPRIALDSVSSSSTDVTVKLSMDKFASNTSYVSLGARTIGTNDYRAKVKVASNGELTLYLVRVISNTEATLGSTVLGSAFNYTTGSTLQIRVEATGTSPTTVRAKVWKTSQTEPAAWQLSTTDSTAGLQAPGGVGVVTYLAGSATNVPVTYQFDDLQAVASP